MPKRLCSLMVAPAKQSLLLQTTMAQILLRPLSLLVSLLLVLHVSQRPNNTCCIKPLVLFSGSMILFALPLSAYFLKCGLQEGHFAERLRSLFHFLNGGRVYPQIFCLRHSPSQLCELHPCHQVVKGGILLSQQNKRLADQKEYALHHLRPRKGRAPLKEVPLQARAQRERVCMRHNSRSPAFGHQTCRKQRLLVVCARH